eukprot:261519_1
MSRLLHTITNIPTSAKDQQKALAEATAVSNGTIAKMKARVTCPQGTAAQYQAAKLYMDSRLKGDTNTVMSLLSDSIHFVSQRDGEFNGKAQFAQYLAKTKVEGSWGTPYVSREDGNMVRIDGQIKYLGLVPVTVKGVFRFGADGKIEELFVGKK